MLRECLCTYSEHHEILQNDARFLNKPTVIWAILSLCALKESSYILHHYTNVIVFWKFLNYIDLLDVDLFCILYTPSHVIFNIILSFALRLQADLFRSHFTTETLNVFTYFPVALSFCNIRRGMEVRRSSLCSVKCSCDIWLHCGGTDGLRNVGL